MNTEIDTAYQNQVTCPYCGHTHEDSWDDEEDVETECGQCERAFRVTTHITIRYSSFKLPS